MAGAITQTKNLPSLYYGVSPRAFELVSMNGSGGSNSLKAQRRNMSSAHCHPEVVQEYLEQEVMLGRIRRAGSEAEGKLMGIHCSPFGVIPKKNRPNKWRLILDLSTPRDTV